LSFVPRRQVLKFLKSANMPAAWIYILRIILLSGEISMNEPSPLRSERGFNPMSKAVDEILRSINEEFKACGQATEEFEAKSYSGF
jgi:hypothetical protein